MHPEDFRRTPDYPYFFTRSTLTTALFEIIRIHSYGIPIRVDFFLTRRVKLALPLISAILERAIKLLRLSSPQFPFDPGTEMIVYARKVC